MIRLNPKVVSNLWNAESEDEQVWWPRCLWIDPGLATGWAVVWFDPYTLVGYSREDVEERTIRSQSSKRGRHGVTKYLVGGHVTHDDPRPNSSIRAILAWDSGQLTGDENRQVSDLLGLASSLGGRGLLVGIENFDLRRLDRSEAFLSPVRIRAALDFQLYIGLPNRGDGATKFDRKKLWSQGPGDAKAIADDSRLKLWDMYVAGPDHQRDALRHCLLHLRKLVKNGRDVIEDLYGWEEEWATPYGKEEE